jgi:UDP-N-acetylmuramate dehydrogenase
MTGIQAALSENDLSSLLADVQRAVAVAIRRGVSASDLTTFSIGGPLDALITLSTASEVSSVCRLLAQSSCDIRIIGNGSNVLVGDAGLSGVTVKLSGELRTVTQIAEGVFDVGAAASLMSLARRVSGEGLSGLEFAAGIPATVGGAVFMNAGAHGAELCERIVHIDCVRSDGSTVRFDVRDLPWRYRHSGLPAGCFVTSVRLKLVPGDKAEISARCAHNLEERRKRQPLSLPSAGSVFKNPSPEMPAGRVIEAAGLKGERIGGAQVSELHANWIVNPEKTAKAADVAALIALCQARVTERLGIDLVPEVRMWLE